MPHLVARSHFAKSARLLVALGALLGCNERTTNPVVHVGPDASRDKAPTDAGFAERSCLPSRHSLTVGELQQELATTTPAVLWIKSLTSLVGTGPLVMSKSAVAVTVPTGLAIFNKASGNVSMFSSEGGELFRSVVATEDGKFLLAGRSAYAVDQDGKVRWKVPLGGSPPIGNEFSVCQSSYSKRLQLLIAICNDGLMYGVSAGERGSVLWSRHVDAGQSDASPSPSASEEALFFFSKTHRPSGTLAVDSNSGQFTGVIIPVDDVPLAMSTQGFLARSSDDWSSMSLLDECGRRRWTVTSTQGYQLPLLVGLPDERIFVAEASGNETWALGMRSIVNGETLGGPVGTGLPVAAGADGTFYAITCLNGRETSNGLAPELVAYTATLQEKWRVTLPVPPVMAHYKCPVASVALDDDGVMYLAVEADGSYLIAVQTGSPGVAPTPWPLRTGNHHGSWWLD